MRVNKVKGTLREQERSSMIEEVMDQAIVIAKKIVKEEVIEEVKAELREELRKEVDKEVNQEFRDQLIASLKTEFDRNTCLKHNRALTFWSV